MQLPNLRLSAKLRRLVGDRRGGPAVEMALAMPALCLFIFGIIEVGYALWMQNALDYSTATAARCASLNGNSCAVAGGNSQVTTFAASQSGANLTSTDFTYNGAAGCGCQVTGNHTMSLDIPWTSLSVTLTSDACYAPPPTQNCAG